mmetsp:Transcript_28452/g.92938  ORF Transcript_28452/g.92938 Transcript_28452/m.92938 type:complete len:672 (+) Transcript_28452:423-2438(+)
MGAEDGVLEVEAGKGGAEEAGERHLGEEALVAVARVEREQAFAEVGEALRDADEEDEGSVLVVVARELAEHAGGARVVGPRGDEPDGEARRLRNLLVRVVAHAREHVHHRELRVGGTEQRERERHRLAHLRLAVLHEVLERPDRHVAANLLAERHHPEPEHGRPEVVCLPLLPLLLRNLLAAHREQRLHLEDVARAGVRARVEHHLAVPRDARAERLGHLERRLHRRLLPEEEEAEPEAHKLGEWLREVLLRAHHQRRHDALRALHVTRPHKHQTERERREPSHLHVDRVVHHQRRQQLLHFLLARPRVRHAEPHDGADPHRGVLLVHRLVEERVRRVALVAHVGVHQPDRQQRARHHVVLRRIQVLVNLREPPFHVPQQNRAQARRRTHLSVVLVLEQPVDALPLPFRGRHQLVVPEPRVHKGVYKRRCQILARRVDGWPGRHTPLHQVRLVNVLRRLRLHNVQVASQSQVVLAQPRVRHNLLKLFELCALLVRVWTFVEVHRLLELQWVSVSGEEERQLTLLLRVCALVEARADVIVRLHHERHAQRLWQLAHLHVNLVRYVEHCGVVRLGEVGRARDEVKARARVVAFVGVLEQEIESLHLEEEVHRLRFGVVLHVERNNLVHERHEVGGVRRFAIRLGPSGELDPDVPGEVAHVLVTPAPDVLLAPQ